MCLCDPNKRTPLCENCRPEPQMPLPKYLKGEWEATPTVQSLGICAGCNQTIIPNSLYGTICGCVPKSGKYDNVLRPFFELMETELHVNSHKGDRPGWLTMDKSTALFEIYYHMSKLTYAVKHDSAKEIIEYSADVANMTMMLLDICGLLTKE